MPSLLLLYDTSEEDLAKDFKDLLIELNVGNIIMIPLAPNKELTLEEKERKNFALANGALFIITPGSERNGVSYPSPSVNVEIGKALEQFKNKPECVILLVDDKCKTPTIVQKPHIPFKRDNIRSVLSALTQLARDLKSAGIFRTAPIPIQTKPMPKQFNIIEFIKDLNSNNMQILPILFEMSNRNDGAISDNDLTKLLSEKHKLSMQQINFLKRDLESYQLVIHSVTSAPSFGNYWWLSDRGWSVARLAAEEKVKVDQKLIGDLLKYFGPGTGSRPIGSP